MSDPMQERRQQLEALVKKHKLAFAIGGAVLLWLAVSDGSVQQSTDTPARTERTVERQPMETGPTTADSGTVDMDDWRRRQAEDDEIQRRRVDAVREEEPCRNTDGSVDRVSIHSGC